jgi:tyrosyl-tRNA synthetase
MLKRDMFQKRLESNNPIYLNEFLYPIMQGYDSVNLQVDVEVCGNDQMFNSLAGRHLSKQLLNKEKFVLTGKLLTTADGSKMGKSENNMISFLDKPNDVYGKVMAFPDESILNGFELLTNKELEEIEKYKLLLENTSINPMDLKKELAFEITKTMHSEEEARVAQEYFEKVFQEKDFQTNLEEISLEKKDLNILDLIKESGLAESKSAARRLVEQSAVTVNNDKIKDINFVIKSEESVVIKVGKKIAKITFA